MFDEIDIDIFSEPMVVCYSNCKKVTIEDVGDWIKFARNSACHGLWGDISGDAVFYGLVTAIIFHNQA